MIKLIQPIIPEADQVWEHLGESFASGQLTNFGPAHQRLTEALTHFLSLPEGRRVLPVASGHIALMAAYRVLGVKRLLIPAYTFESTRCAATLQGIDVVYTDVDPWSGCLTPELLAQVPLDTYDAVVVVCALSMIPDLPALEAYCLVNGKALIVDAAPCFGADPVVARHGVVCFSFHATKTYSVGEGGAIVLPEALYDRARAFINFGRHTDYTVIIPGLNGKLPEYSCAVALSVLQQLPAELEARQRNEAQYRARLGSLVPITLYPTTCAFLPVQFMAVGGTARAVKVRERLGQAGIACLQYYPPLVPLPTTSNLYAGSVCLPIHSGITPEVVDSICDIALQA